MSRNTLIAVIASVALHLLLLGVLLFNFSRPPKIASLPEQPEIIQATVLGDLGTPVDADRKHREEQRQTDEEQRQIEEAQRQLQREEQQHKAEIAAQTEREEQERQKIEERKKAEELKKADERKKAEELKKAEERKKAEESKKAEERKKAEAEKERKAAEEKLKRQMAAEEKRLQDERAQEQRKQQISDWTNQYVASITAKITRNWLRPLDSPDDFTCKLHLMQSPAGEVLDVRVTESCGSALLDRSVENAVRKASPLPPPPDPAVFDREINIRFRPRG